MKKHAELDQIEEALDHCRHQKSFDGSARAQELWQRWRSLVDGLGLSITRNGSARPPWQRVHWYRGS